jgi:Flp pilus assembly protein TadG
MSRRRYSRGSTMIEFAFLSVTLLVLMFFGIELDRMLFVYTCIADSAKAGARYAITHGSDRTGSGVDGPSGPGDSPAQVVAAVQKYAKQMINPAALTVTITYPDSANTTGSRVNVLVQYAYDPYTVLPLHVTLSATSQGVITF